MSYTERIILKHCYYGELFRGFMLINEIFKIFIPDNITKDILQYTRAKNLVGACIISTIASPIFILLYYFLHAHFEAYLIILAELFILSSLLILKYFSSLFYARHLLLTALAGIIIWLTYRLGGIFSAPSYWLTLLPLVAAFIGGMRVGYFWCVVSIVAISIFYLLEYLNFSFPVSQLANPLLLQYFSISGLVLVIISLVYFYERGKRTTLKRLHYIAYHDALTNLSNRLAYDEMLENIISKTKKRTCYFSIICFNVDNFKKINNAFGQNIGDLLLKEIAHRLKRYVYYKDTLARVGGDEFKVIIERKADPVTVKQFVEFILMVLKTPYYINTDKLDIMVSVGISYYPFNHFQPAAVDRHANVALAKAKELGGNRIQYFTENLAKEDTLHMEIERNLPHALSNNELSLNFQPQFDTQNHTKITGIEALLRWNSDRYTHISSSVFIPIAEKIGIIVELGEWVLKQACLQYMKWYKEGLVNDKIYLAVNISVHQLYRENFIDFVKQVLQETDIPPSNLEFELTETAVITDKSYAIAILQKLNMLGIHTVIDDFGTGYTSLSYLTAMPVSGLKIDKSFIDDAVKENNSPIIIASLIELAHKMNLTVVAEGIESVEQLNYLKLVHCDYAQGYFLSKPLDEARIRVLLQAQRS
ncbi:MAG: hypothetical protein ACD_45C00556G0001 [uncultured bacterium]|nr:MAG: hypothetical protein ACD_45C00556G0001 [uncultured bacterium]